MAKKRLKAERDLIDAIVSATLPMIPGIVEKIFTETVTIRKKKGEFIPFEDIKIKR